MKGLLWLILAIYVLLAIACGAINPLFEAPDEQHHFYTAQEIVQTRRLPVYSEESLALQEAAQPPLTYLLTALVLAPLDTSQRAPGLQPNPYVQPGVFGSESNINAFAHTPDEAWPWRGLALGVHLARFLSTLFGLGTLLCVYAAGRLLWPEIPTRSLLATALVGFSPQYVFLHSSITNDTLLIFLSSAALWQFLRLWLDKATTWRLLAVGLTIGLAALTKTTGVLLLAPAAVVILLLAWREGRWSLVLRYGGLVLVPAALLSGWMYWRTWTLYGDPFAVNVFVERAGGDRHLTVGGALSQFGRVWRSSIAVLGWMNLTAPAWVYAIWNGLVLLGAVGFLAQGARSLWRQFAIGDPAASEEPVWCTYRGWIAAGLLALWPLLVFVSWLLFMMRTPADQGRLLFPAILPVSLALAYGLSRWGRRWTFPVASLLAFATAVYCVFILLPQAYVLPTLIEETEIPQTALRLNHDLGLGVELVASEIKTPSVRPGETADAVLYWRSQGTTTEEVLVQSEILGQEHAQIGRVPATYHGGGLYPSSLWPPDKIVRERVKLSLADEAATPTQGRLFVHLAGQEAFAEAGSVKVIPRSWPQPDKEVLAQLGDGIALTGAMLEPMTTSAGGTVSVLLRWQIAHAPGKNLTTFVHLGDPAHPPLAQADGPALGGDYPTAMWGSGEVFDDRYELQLPADIPSGRYPVHVGLYNPQSGQRLPLLIDGQRQPGDALLVGRVDVE